MTPAPHVLVEAALAASHSDGCVVILDEDWQANLRWAEGTLTTNGLSHDRRMTVVALAGRGERAAAGAVTRTVHDVDDIEPLVRSAESVAAHTEPEQSARPLVAGEAAADFAEPPALGGMDGLRPLSERLGDLLGWGRGTRVRLSGFAEHRLCTTYLATSTGVRHRHVQPAGRLTVTARSADGTRSTWSGRASRDLAAVDLEEVRAELAQRLAWSERRVALAPGRYPAVLPPTAVADLAVSTYWEMAALPAHDGRTAFAQPGRGTRVGQQLVDERVTLHSDPGYPGLECSDVVVTPASGPAVSVFDNGLPVGATSWLRHGRLEALVQTRFSADLTGLPMTPAVDNLVLTVDGGRGGVEELVARTDEGILLTSLWYIREVDPQSLLLTGLTRDGVFVVRGGEVVGVTSNFRFNDSPLALLAGIRDAGRTVVTHSREWGDYYRRTAAPPLAVESLHLSTVSEAV